MAYERTIKNKFQTLRTKLLYFIYCCPNSRLKDEPGIKSKLRKALGYKSDGHFYPDFNNLVNTGLIEKENGYYKVSKKGKEEFALQSTSDNNTRIMIIIGVFALVYSYLQTLGFSLEAGFAFLGVVLIVFGAGNAMRTNKNKPKIPLKAKILLKKLKKN